MLSLLPYLYYFYSALNKLPNTQDSSEFVYRGVPASSRAEVEVNYSVGMEVYWSSFTSVSKNPAQAKEFAQDRGIIFRIRAHECREVAAYSEFPEEEEALLRPNTKLKVTRALYEGEGLLRGCQVVDLEQEMHK